MLVDFGGRVIERRRLERAFPLPEEAVAFVTESVDALRPAWPAADDARGSPGSASPLPYNLGSWQRELDVPLARLPALERVRYRARSWRTPPGIDVFCENDGTAAAVAELFHGRRPRRSTTSSTCSSAPHSAAGWSWTATTIAASTPTPATSA